MHMRRTFSDRFCAVAIIKDNSNQKIKHTTHTAAREKSGRRVVFCEIMSARKSALQAASLFPAANAKTALSFLTAESRL